MIQNLLERFLRGPTYHTIYSCQHHSAHILWQTELLLMNIITITLGNLGAKQNKILEIMNLPQSWQIFQSWILDILPILRHFAIHSNDDDNASMMMTMRRITMMIVMMDEEEERSAVRLTSLSRVTMTGGTSCHHLNGDEQEEELGFGENN